jgi:putative hydrolase of HD superfamily
VHSESRNDELRNFVMDRARTTQVRGELCAIITLDVLVWALHKPDKPFSPHLGIFLSSDLQKIIDFIIEVDKLKGVLRKTKPVGLNRYENVAEHSWQVCLLAQLLSPYAGAPVDIVRVTELLLVHDIPEIDIGDQIVYQTKDDSRAVAEREAAARIFGLLPELQAGWLMSRWQEYEDRKTSEAIFAYSIDRLMPVLHNINNNGQSWRENRVPLEKILAVNAVIAEACPPVWEYVRDILAQLSKEGLFDYGIKHT